MADNILITLRQRNLHVLKVDTICTVECSTFRLEYSVEKNVSRSTEQIEHGNFIPILPMRD